MTTSSEFRTMSTEETRGNLVTGAPPPPILTRGPVSAIMDVPQLDANHNRTDFKSMDMDQRTSSLRRIQSESATAEYKTNTLPMYSREMATAQIVSKPVRKTESVTAEIKGRENGHWKRDQKVQFVDGKCGCCPYGYHVDLDFVNYCETLSDGSYLSKLKRIEREKRKLRKSMEVFLRQQEQSEDYHSNMESANFIKTIDYQNSATNKMLDEIDSSVGNTIQSIDHMMYTTRFTSDSEESSSSAQNSMKFSTFPRSRGKNIQEEITQYNSGYVTTGLNDSQNSLSSISTLSSEKASPMVSTFGQSSSSNVTVHDETTFQRITQITSDQLAATMATHLPSDDGAASPQSNTTNMSKQSLQAIREAMAFSLQRMKELEEQVKALPVLQVRISVLKEEKRLLELKLKAKDRKPSTRTIGVSDDRIDDVPKQKSPPPTPPKKVRMVGVGDRSVLEPYLLQPNLPESYTIRDNEMFSKETYVLERERSQTAVYSPFTKTPPKPLTRTIGVGESNVFDDGLKIHEKELRTVILGQTQSVGKRNVGVECRVHTRDVGVSYAFDDEKPTTRTVGVGVNLDYGMVNFKAEEMRTAIQTVLHRSVRSIGVTCDFKPQKVDAGIQYSSYSLRSIGVGDCNIDVECRPPVPKRTIGIDALPTVFNKSVNTDHGWKLDASTSTVRMFTDNKASMTERARQNNTGTMTEEKATTSDTTQTEKKVFIFMDQIKNASCNTQKIRTSNAAMNTDIERQKMKFTKSCNTEQVRRRDIGIGDDRIDSFICSFEDDEPKMEETTEEIVYKTEEKIVESGWTDRLKAQQMLRKFETYGDESTNESSKEVTQTSDDTTLKMIQNALDSSKKSDNVNTDQKSWKDLDKMEEVVEKKITSQGDGGNYTVTTITTRKSLGDDKQTSVTKRGDIGGQEISQVILSGADMGKMLGESSDMSSSRGLVSMSDGSGGTSDSGYSSRHIVTKISGSVAGGGVNKIEKIDLTGDGDLSGGGYTTSKSIITRSSALGGDQDGDHGLSSGGYTNRQVISKISSKQMSSSPGDFDISSDGNQSFSSGGYTIRTSSSSSGSGMSPRELSDNDQRSSSEGFTRTKIISSRVSSSSSGDHEMSPSVHMKIGQMLDDSQEMSSGSSRSEYSTTVIRSSNISGDTGDQSLSTSEQASKLKAELDDLGVGLKSSTGIFETSETIVYDIGGKSYYEKYLDLTGGRSSKSSDGGLTIQNQHSQSPGGGSSASGQEQKTGILKSCIKKSKEETQVKKGITFAENVTGGYTSSSTEEDSTAEEEEEEGSDSSSDDDDDSYEEGSYDGREGSIVYQCKDDEAIAQGLPGAKMFDQNIRETYELSDEMRVSCEVLAKYLEDSTEVQTKELNKSLNVIQQDWFKISSHKLSETHQVEDFLSCFNEISPRLLEYVVNMQDSNGNTAVHYAVSHCNFEIVNLLLDTGVVDLNKQNKAGYTATMLCTLAYTQTDRQREVAQRLFSMSDVDATASKASIS
ncbi:hypothetical protein KUTeg_015971 [Tegillarca granosa]|uniref:KN motif and ankyrin repeat domain-containing protein 1 n=1 Tax=Tegillarca granosa TaxID=220873 RepID=A0ABQ9ENE9_TEGGR|nr:hypothetical protein KUTeg_015971 [Tegillarca granosa]